jgi:hypothetical protein
MVILRTILTGAITRNQQAIFILTTTVPVEWMVVERAQIQIVFHCVLLLVSRHVSRAISWCYSIIVEVSFNRWESMDLSRFADRQVTTTPRLAAVQGTTHVDTQMMESAMCPGTVPLEITLIVAVVARVMAQQPQCFRCKAAHAQWTKVGGV